MADLERDGALSGSRLEGGAPRCTPTPRSERLPSETPLLSSLVVECRPRSLHVAVTVTSAKHTGLPSRVKRLPHPSSAWKCQLVPRTRTPLVPCLSSVPSTDLGARSKHLWGGRRVNANCPDQDSSYPTTFPGPC